MPYKTLELRRANYATKRDQKLAVRRAHTEAHREEITQYKKQYRKEHANEIKAYNATYYIAHKEEMSPRKKQYKEEHKEQLRQYDIDYRKTNLDKIKDREREYRKNHKEKVNARNRKRFARKIGAPINDFTAQQWYEMKEHFHHRCAYCGKKSQRLTQDHVTPLSAGGSHTKSNIVPACQTCNSKKHTGPPLKPVQPLLL